MLEDILKKEKEGKRRYSQSRVYLFGLLIVLTIVLILNLIVDINSGKLNTSIEYLFYLIIVFSGYALGEKGIDVMNFKYRDK